MTVLITRKRQRTSRRHKESGLKIYKDYELVNLKTTLDWKDQSTLVPFNEAFEFPRNQLKLGKLLGSGAFGVVHKGIAKNIRKNEAETVVAVKMLRSGTEDAIMHALITELRIMSRLESHPNVVNLLGAVTRNISKSRFYFL